MLLRGKKGGQEGAPKRKLKNLLLRTRKLEHLADENEIELESKENSIKKWSSKSNPSRFAWLLRLKKGNQAGLSQAGGWGGWRGFSPLSFWPNSSSYLNQGQGGRLCPPQYYEPPGFSDLATALSRHTKRKLKNMPNVTVILPNSSFVFQIF